MTKLDVVLINPNGSGAYTTVSDHLPAIEPPIWAGLLASLVRRRNYSVRIIDANAERLTDEQVAARIKDLDAKLVCIVAYGHNPSASTQLMPAITSLTHRLKDEWRVLIVGGHPSSLPRTTLYETDAWGVSNGEGTYTLLDVLEGAPKPRSLVRKLQVLVGKELTREWVGDPAPLVMNLCQEMPGVAWDLLPMHLYRAHNWHAFPTNGVREPYAALYTTLGCPYSCHFCCINAPFRMGAKAMGLSHNCYRYWSPENILTQIDDLVKNYGIKNLKFADELFVLNPKHVTAICKGLIERKYDLNIWAYARVNTITDPLLDLLRKAGVRWLALGIESINSKVLEAINKQATPDATRKAVQQIRAHGIYIGANYIFGLPEDDFVSMEETLQFAMSINAEWANMYHTIPYPGSKLYEDLLRENKIKPGQWHRYSPYAADALCLGTVHLSGEEVIDYRDQAFVRYFDRLAYKDMLAHRFGPAAVQDVEEMLERPLVRAWRET